MTRWFRMYDAVLDDPKVQKLPDAAFRAWVNLMCLASRNSGKISGSLEDLSFALRKSEGKTRELLEILITADLLDVSESGYEPHNWSIRQYKSDVSTDRVKRFRDRSCNVSETPPEQKQSRTEQNTPKPDKPGAVLAKTIPEDFEDFWKAYIGPKNSKKPDALKAWAATAKIRPPLPDLLRAVANYLAWISEETRKQKRDYPKQHHATWLRGEMWNNYGDGGSALTPEQIAINKDRADKVMGRGKYAPEQMRQ